MTLLFLLTIIFGLLIIKNNESFYGYYDKPVTYTRRPTKTIYNKPQNTNHTNHNTNHNNHNHNTNYHNHSYYTNRFWFDYYNPYYYYYNPYYDLYYDYI